MLVITCHCALTMYTQLRLKGEQGGGAQLIQTSVIQCLHGGPAQPLPHLFPCSLQDKQLTLTHQTL